MPAETGRLLAWEDDDAPLALPDGVRRGLERPAVEAGWRLDAVAGRFVEVSAAAAGAPLTVACRLILDAQRQGEPAAWVGRRESCFFPPDAMEAGVDLAALAVVRTVDAIGSATAADLLIRSGAFGLVVMDLGVEPRLPLHAQTRLAGLAQQHTTALVCLTGKTATRPSIGSLVSLRAHVERVARESDRFRCEIRVVKDKRRGPGWRHAEVCRGPDGLH